MATAPIIQILLDNQINTATLDAYPYTLKINSTGIGYFGINNLCIYGYEERSSQETTSYSNPALSLTTFNPDTIKLLGTVVSSCKYNLNLNAYPSLRNLILTLTQPVITSTNDNSKIYLYQDLLMKVLVTSVDPTLTLQEFVIFPREAFCIFKDIITLYNPLRFSSTLNNTTINETQVDSEGLTEPSPKFRQVLTWFCSQ